MSRSSFQSIGTAAAKVIAKAATCLCIDCGARKLSPTAKRCPSCTHLHIEARKKAAKQAAAAARRAGR